MGQFDSSTGRPEDQADGVHGARAHACSLTDATVRLEQGEAAVDDADDLPFRTGLGATAGSDAAVGIDHRVEGNRLSHAGGDRLSKPLPGAPAHPVVVPEVAGDDGEGDESDQGVGEGIEGHGHLRILVVSRLARGVPSA